MLPSNMLLKIGNIQGYNNNLLIANESVKIGVVKSAYQYDTKSMFFHKTSSRSTKNIYQKYSLGLNYCGYQCNSSWLLSHVNTAVKSSAREKIYK